MSSTAQGVLLLIVATASVLNAYRPSMLSSRAQFEDEARLDKEMAALQNRQKYDELMMAKAMTKMMNQARQSDSHSTISAYPSKLQQLYDLNIQENEIQPNSMEDYANQELLVALQNSRHYDEEMMANKIAEMKMMNRARLSGMNYQNAHSSYYGDNAGRNGEFQPEENKVFNPEEESYEFPNQEVMNNPSYRKAMLYQQMIANQMMSESDDDQDTIERYDIDTAVLEEVQETDMIIGFEGDMDLPASMIRKYYNVNESVLSDIISTYGDGTRVNATDNVVLWDSKVIPYEISTSFTESEIEAIESAIVEWSDETCINFVLHSNETDFIYFDRHTTSCRSGVGRTGGKQTILLSEECMKMHGNILQLIGHTIGLWNEQSRPDRDSYVTVYQENIQQGSKYNFLKRKDKYADFQGTEYDYRSVMHFPVRKFQRAPPCLPLEFNNKLTFERQGEPLIGQKEKLSEHDILEVNRLYNCPGDGRLTVLHFYIREGRNLRDSERSGTHNPYVEIIAVDSDGNKEVKKSSIEQGRNPTWNNNRYFSYGEWQFFRIRVWDDEDKSPDIPMSMSQTVPLQLDSLHREKEGVFCANVACDQRVTYDCRQYLQGKLTITVKDGYNIPKVGLYIDPFVKIIAEDYRKSEHVEFSGFIRGTSSPVWNAKLTFKKAAWARFTVELWEKALPNKLLHSHTYYVREPVKDKDVTMEFVSMESKNAGVRFSYTFE